MSATNLLAILAIIESILALLQATSEFNRLLARAVAEGRDLTDAELADYRRKTQAAVARMLATP